MSDQDSKMTMLQRLAPNAMKAYKRKKLLFFPSSNNNSMQGQAEMEIDSGDEGTEFPSIPPLPDDEPPPAPRPPPPPPASPPPPPPASSPPLPPTSPLPPSPPQEKSESPRKSPKLKTADINEKAKDVPMKSDGNDKTNIDKNMDIEQIDLSSEIDEIQIIDDDLITIDEDYDSPSQISSNRNSPTLDDLEQKKRLLLNALESNVSELDMSIDMKSSPVKAVQNENEATESEIEEILESAVKKMEEERRESKKVDTKTDASQGKNEVADDDITVIFPPNEVEDSKEVNAKKGKSLDKDQTTNKKEGNSKTKSDVANITVPDCTTSVAQADNKAGQVKTTHYGTPLLNVASSYKKLPSDEKFSKDICDVINFENLPNSIGKYKKICSLLKKVKIVVDSIQES